MGHSTESSIFNLLALLRGASPPLRAASGGLIPKLASPDDLLISLDNLFVK